MLHLAILPSHDNHDKKTKALVIAIIYVSDVCFIDTKGSLLLNELKQKFMAR